MIYTDMLDDFEQKDVILLSALPYLYTPMQPITTFWDRRPPKSKTPRSMSVALPVDKFRKSSVTRSRLGSRSLSLPTTIFSDQAECLFFAVLPAEIRIQVYTLLLENDSSQSEEEQLQLYYTHRLKPNQVSSNPNRFSFILVCKRLTAEILPIAYAAKTFQLVNKGQSQQSQKEARLGRAGLHLETLKENLKNSMRLGVKKKKTSSIEPGTPACLANASMLRRAAITNWDAHNLTISWDQISSLLMPFSNLSQVEIRLEFPWAFRREVNGRGFCLDPLHVNITVRFGSLRADDRDSVLCETNDPISCQRIAQEQYELAVNELPERFAMAFPPNRQPEWAQLMKSQMLNVLEGVSSGFLEGERGFREISVQKVELRPMHRRQ